MLRIYTPAFGAAVAAVRVAVCPPSCSGCIRSAETQGLLNNDSSEYDLQANINLLFGEPMGDMWDDAELVGVVRYLATNSYLELPKGWPHDWCP